MALRARNAATVVALVLAAMLSAGYLAIDATVDRALITALPVLSPGDNQGLTSFARPGVRVKTNLEVVPVSAQETPKTPRHPRARFVPAVSAAPILVQAIVTLAVPILETPQKVPPARKKPKADGTPKGRRHVVASAEVAPHDVMEVHETSKGHALKSRGKDPGKKR